MRSAKITLGVAALALGSTLIVAPASAQSSPPSTRGLHNRGLYDSGSFMPTNDGGAAITTEGNYIGLPSAAGGQSADAASCAARFHSYDPSSGTYLGFDGRRHSCP